MADSTTKDAVPKKAWQWLIGVALIAAIPLLIWGVDWPNVNDQSTSAASGSGQVEQASAMQTTFNISLLGEDRLSEAFNTNRMVPGGWDYRWSCPDQSIQVHWKGGPSGPCMSEWGERGGEFRFSGLVGEVVTIHIIPPS